MNLVNSAAGKRGAWCATRQALLWIFAVRRSQHNAERLLWWVAPLREMVVLSWKSLAGGVISATYLSAEMKPFTD